MTKEQIAHFIEESICIKCGGDDLECLDNCTKHICVDCKYHQETSYREENTIDN